MARHGLQHAVTGRWRLGFFLAAVAMLTWAVLPIALSIGLRYIDPWTLTWFRFSVAMLFVSAWFGRRGRVSPGSGADGRGRKTLLVVAAFALTANYILYILGLELTTPAVSQVLIQLAPVLLALGGIWLFGERYSASQWIGFAVLVAGLSVFFHNQLGAFAEDTGRIWRGAALIVAGALAWAVYAMAQKQLLRDYSSGTVMLVIYVFATLVLLPTTTPRDLMDLDLFAWIIVASCGLNTLIAYGAFAEALNHWEASRVSAVLALTPLGTLAFEAAVERLFEGALPPERLDWTSFVGAGLVVAGSIVTSLSGSRRPIPDASA
jgi:drug/metabolite transporter (DMT)-like permease